MNLFKTIKKQDIEHIELIFENTASVKINPYLFKYFNYFKHELIDMNLYKKHTVSNSAFLINETTVDVSKLDFKLAKKANTRYCNFDVVGKGQRLFDRINVKDITFINITYITKNSKREILKLQVPYSDGESWFEANNYQKNKLTTDGLIVEIIAPCESKGCA